MSSPSPQPSQAPGAPQPPEQLLGVACGYIASSCLYAVAKLGIADLLVAGPRTTSDLAAASGANEDALYRTLRALATVGMFTESAPRTFALTPPVEYLRSDHPQSRRDLVAWMCDPLHFQIYAHTLYSVETGKIGMVKAFGMEPFAYFEQNKEESEVFNRAMTDLSAMVVPAVLEAYDFSGIGTLVDVAGGHGMVLTSILKANPQMHGILFDVEHVVAGAGPLIKSARVEGRCEARSGDFFREVPAGDAIIMKHIIHDWDDERASVILRNCHRALPANGRVILVEAVVPDGNTPHFAKWLDIEMLMLPGGRERTEAEFFALFAKSGFKLSRVVPTRSPVCVVEATKL